MLWPFFLAALPLAGQAQKELGPHARPARESVRVLDEVVERLTAEPLYRDNDVELLLDGPDTHAEMIAAISAAEHQVHLETYIFADDEAGARFADVLAAKARQGIPVRVIFDSIGSRDNAAEFWERLESAGVAIREFNPPETFLKRNPFQIDNRDHRKLLIVDGRVAFTGGINIDRSYLRPSHAVGGRSSTSGWRDTHVRVSGPVVAAFETLFKSQWEKLGAPLVEPPYAPPPEQLAKGNALVRVLAGAGSNAEVSDVWIAYRSAAKVADSRVWITQSYFAPDDGLLAAIHECAERGVDVRILVAGFSDSELLLNASRYYYADLLAAGVKVYESQERILHAKTMVVDGYWSTVGSSNLDYLSFLHNDEANAVIVSAEFAAELEGVFLRDLEHAKEIDLDDWQGRSVWQRTKELGSYLLRYRL